MKKYLSLFLSLSLSAYCSIPFSVFMLNYLTKFHFYLLQKSLHKEMEDVFLALASVYLGSN